MGACDSESAVQLVWTDIDNTSWQQWQVVVVCNMQGGALLRQGVPEELLEKWAQFSVLSNGKQARHRDSSTHVRTSSHFHEIHGYV